MKYDVFISYSRNDYVDENKNLIPGNVVSIIKNAIKGAGFTYWFDEEGIYSGENFAEKIVNNIEDSRVFLFVSTANSNKSRWTCKEIATADEFGKHIIPIKIDNTPYSKKILFRIADLDFIEYNSNPELGIQKMIDSIREYLTRSEGVESEHQQVQTIQDSPLIHQNKKQKDIKSNTIFDAIKNGFNNYFDFQGRATRKEYWWWMLFLLVVVLGGYLILEYFAHTTHTVRWLMGLIFWVFILFGLFVPTISVSVRRCHDTNHNGWWIMVPIYSIVLMCLPSKG